MATSSGGTSKKGPMTDLKDKIRKRIPADMIGRVIDNFNVRVAAVQRQGSAWIEHIN